MANASEADKAIGTLNGTNLGGRTLTINEAKPKANVLGAVVVEPVVLVAEAGATTIAAIHGNRANRAGSFFECTKSSGQATKCLSGNE